ncbi:MAG: hypothetical protein WA962_13175 [Ornithinimicrobium sp.]
MSSVSVMVWLAGGYAGFLLLLAYGLDLMARRTSRHTADWRTGSFTYHEDHDAWVCPEDQWLWPQSFDPENRVMRYRANPLVCNACPVKDTCTTSAKGREISRNVDPWPHSEAGRFHRGIACAVTVLATCIPLFSMIGQPITETAILAGTSVLMALASLPLWSHLRSTPPAFPEHVPVETLGGPVPVEIRQPPVADPDRFVTRWGSFGHDTGRAPGQHPTDADDEATTRAGWSRIKRR